MRTRSQAAITIVPKHSEQTPPETHRSPPPPPPPPPTAARTSAQPTEATPPLAQVRALVDQIVDTILDYKQRTLLDELVRAVDALTENDTATTAEPIPARGPVAPVAPIEAAPQDALRAEPVAGPVPPATPQAEAPQPETAPASRETAAPPTAPLPQNAPRVEAPVITVIPRALRESRRKILRATKQAAQPVVVDRNRAAVTPIPSKPVDAEPFSGSKSVAAYTLIVEPAVTRQSAIISTLDEAGIKAQIVTGAESTLRTLSRLSFDVILVSLALPDHESLDIVREIRRREVRTTNGQRMPVYGLAEPRDRIDGGRALAIGLDGILDAVPSASTIGRLCDQWVAEREAAEEAQDDSIINTAALAGLRREPRETANRLLRHYLAAAARHISAIRRGISLGHMLAAEEGCKALRAASAPFGAVGVVECCHTVEALIRGERPVKMRPLVEELDQLFRATRNQLQSIVSDL